MRHLTRGYIPYVIAAVVAVVSIVAAIFLVSGGGSDDQAAANATATFAVDQDIQLTPTLGPDEAAVSEAANRFIAALAIGDGDALYALQTEAYKQTCSREDFDTVVAALKTQPLQGPAKVDLQGNNAAVALRTSAGQQVVLPMKKESDGSWRVVARVSGSCL